jgi:hypothetical protein
MMPKAGACSGGTAFIATVASARDARCVSSISLKSIR